MVLVQRHYMRRIGLGRPLIPDIARLLPSLPPEFQKAIKQAGGAATVEQQLGTCEKFGIPVTLAVLARGPEGWSKSLSVTGLDELRDSYNSKKRVIVIEPHIGCVGPLIGQHLALCGIPITSFSSIPEQERRVMNWIESTVLADSIAKVESISVPNVTALVRADRAIRTNRALLWQPDTFAAYRSDKYSDSRNFGGFRVPVSRFLPQVVRRHDADVFVAFARLNRQPWRLRIEYRRLVLPQASDDAFLDALYVEVSRIVLDNVDQWILLRFLEDSDFYREWILKSGPKECQPDVM